jgi:hypothetical protein
MMVCLPTGGGELVLAEASGLGLVLADGLELGCGEPDPLAAPRLVLGADGDAETVPPPGPVTPVPLVVAADVGGATSLVTVGGWLVAEDSSAPDRVTLCGAVVGWPGRAVPDAVSRALAVPCALLREAAAADAELT